MVVTPPQEWSLAHSRHLISHCWIQGWRWSWRKRGQCWLILGLSCPWNLTLSGDFPVTWNFIPWQIGTAWSEHQFWSQIGHWPSVWHQTCPLLGLSLGSSPHRSVPDCFHLMSIVPTPTRYRKCSGHQTDSAPAFTRLNLWDKTTEGLSSSNILLFCPQATGRCCCILNYVPTTSYIEAFIYWSLGGIIRLRWGQEGGALMVGLVVL